MLGRHGLLHPGMVLLHLALLENKVSSVVPTFSFTIVVTVVWIWLNPALVVIFVRVFFALFVIIWLSRSLVVVIRMSRSLVVIFRILRSPLVIKVVVWILSLLIVRSIPAHALVAVQILSMVTLIVIVLLLVVPTIVVIMVVVWVVPIVVTIVITIIFLTFFWSVSGLLFCILIHLIFDFPSL